LRDIRAIFTFRQYRQDIGEKTSRWANNPLGSAHASGLPLVTPQMRGDDGPTGEFCAHSVQNSG